MEEKSMSDITKRVPVIVETEEEIDANGNLPPVLRVVGGIPWEKLSMPNADEESVYSFHSCSESAEMDEIHFIVNGRELRASFGGP